MCRTFSAIVGCEALHHNPPGWKQPKEKRLGPGDALRRGWQRACRSVGYSRRGSQINMDKINIEFPNWHSSALIRGDFTQLSVMTRGGLYATSYNGFLKYIEGAGPAQAMRPLANLIRSDHHAAPLSFVHAGG